MSEVKFSEDANENRKLHRNQVGVLLLALCFPFLYLVVGFVDASQENLKKPSMLGAMRMESGKTEDL